MNELLYKVLKRAKPGKSTSEGMVYYPYPVRRGTYNLSEIAHAISMKSSMSRGDVYGVLTGLVDEIANKVSEGSIVKLGELGTFKLNLKTDLKESEDDVSARDIKGNRLVFIPNKFIKSLLSNVVYRKQAK